MSKKHILKNCEFCGCSYTARRERQRFCNKNCQYAFTRRHIVERVVVCCCICDKELIRKKDGRLGTKSYCSSCFKSKRIGHKLTEEHRKIISETRRRDWERGIYNNAVVGKTKWHDYIRPNGEKIRCQGTWELLYATYLDNNNIEYVAHKGSLRYRLANDDIERVYLPDFYLIKEDCYVDVKNDYIVKVDQKKIESVKRCNPKINLKIVTKKDLIKLGVLKN